MIKYWQNLINSTLQRLVSWLSASHCLLNLFLRVYVRVHTSAFVWCPALVFMHTHLLICVMDYVKNYLPEELGLIVENCIDVEDESIAECSAQISALISFSFSLCFANVSPCRLTGSRMTMSSIHRRTPTFWSPSITTWSSNRLGSRTPPTTPVWLATLWPRDAAARLRSSFMVAHIRKSTSFLCTFVYLQGLIKKKWKI